MPRYGIDASSKPETSQRPVDYARSSEVRSCSSGKQRRSRFPSGFSDKEITLKMSFVAEEKLVSLGKPRSPSPSASRRSISTDRGALHRSRVKFDTVDDQPLMKAPFPARVPVTKLITQIPGNPSTSNYSRAYTASQELAKQDNISDSFSSFQRVTHRKVFPEHEEEQFKQALNVRQGGIRKSKADIKAKAKHHLPTKIQKSDVALTFLSDVDGGKMEEPRKSDFSEPENEAGLVGSPSRNTFKLKKLRQNFSKISQNLEPRGLVQPVEPLLAGKYENKLPNGVIRSVKEGSNTTMPEFRRSRSSPRGKFMILP